MGACLPNLKFVSLVILELLSFNAQKFKGSRDHSRAPVRNFFRKHLGTFPGSMRAKFEVRIFRHFRAFNFNAHNLRGYVTLATPPLRKIFSGVMTRLPLRACLPNWKFVHVDILELLAFNAQKFTESRDPCLLYTSPSPRD